MEVKENIIGQIKGQDVIRYSLRNSKGLEVKVLNYGGIITDIIVPDKNGVRENVVLKYKDIESYEENPSYFGAFVGRTAGRICNGIITIDGKTIELNKNYNPHSGHGGNEGFNKKFFDVTTESFKEESYVELSRISPDLEEYYPGNLTVKVRYILTENNELKIQYYGKSDKNTLVNFTNHSYFNLSGNAKNNILEQYLEINTNSIVEINKAKASSGKILNIEDSEFDFREMKAIGKDINGDHKLLKICNGYDLPWYIDGVEGPQLKLYDEKSGRLLEITTDRKSIVVYSHNYPDDRELENGHMGGARMGLAIEPQNPPIGEGLCYLEDSLLMAEDEYKSETIYKFIIKE